eukprot:1178211-Prorocentrum_minimum.AAC.4
MERVRTEKIYPAAKVVRLTTFENSAGEARLTPRRASHPHIWSSVHSDVTLKRTVIETTMQMIPTGNKTCRPAPRFAYPHVRRPI